VLFLETDRALLTGVVARWRHLVDSHGKFGGYPDDFTLTNTEMTIISDLISNILEENPKKDSND
jgi:hypothetical protein